MSSKPQAPNKPQPFSPDFLEQLPEDNIEALSALLEECVSYLTGRLNKDGVVPVYAVLSAFFEERPMTQFGMPESFDLDRATASSTFALINGLRFEVDSFKRKRDADAHKEKFKSIFAKRALYLFTDDEINDIQKLIDEVRGLITNSSVITDSHKQRVLARLEAMQSELHRKTTKIDGFFMFMGQFGICIGKFGEDIKPISEKVDKLGKMIMRVVAVTEGAKHLPEIIQKALGEGH
jgi:hypothetical protein